MYSWIRGTPLATLAMNAMGQPEVGQDRTRIVVKDTLGLNREQVRCPRPKGAATGPLKSLGRPHRVLRSPAAVVRGMREGSHDASHTGAQAFSLARTTTCTPPKLANALTGLELAVLTPKILVRSTCTDLTRALLHPLHLYLHVAIAVAGDRHLQSVAADLAVLHQVSTRRQISPPSVR